MSRTKSSSRPSELNSRSFPQKKRRIDNMPLRYGSNRRASSTFVSQREYAPSGITPWRKITTLLLQCRNSRAKCKSKVKEVCWRSAATENCRSVHALCQRSNLKSRASPPLKSTISLARLKGSSKTRSSGRRCISTKRTSLASRLSSSRSRWKTNGRRTTRRSISRSTFASQRTAGASEVFSF